MCVGKGVGKNSSFSRAYLPLPAGRQGQARRKTLSLPAQAGEANVLNQEVARMRCQ